MNLKKIMSVVCSISVLLAPFSVDAVDNKNSNKLSMPKKLLIGSAIVAGGVAGYCGYRYWQRHNIPAAPPVGGGEVNDPEQLENEFQNEFINTLTELWNRCCDLKRRHRNNLLAFVNSISRDYWEELLAFEGYVRGIHGQDWRYMSGHFSTVLSRDKIRQYISDPANDESTIDFYFNRFGRIQAILDECERRQSEVNGGGDSPSETIHDVRLNMSDKIRQKHGIILSDKFFDANRESAWKLQQITENDRSDRQLKAWLGELGLRDLRPVGCLGCTLGDYIFGHRLRELDREGSSARGLLTRELKELVTRKRSGRLSENLMEQVRNSINALEDNCKHELQGLIFDSWAFLIDQDDNSNLLYLVGPQLEGMVSDIILTGFRRDVCADVARALVMFEDSPMYNTFSTAWGEEAVAFLKRFNEEVLRLGDSGFTTRLPKDDERKARKQYFSEGIGSEYLSDKINWNNLNKFASAKFDSLHEILKRRTIDSMLNYKISFKEFQNILKGINADDLPIDKGIQETIKTPFIDRFRAALENYSEDLENGEKEKFEKWLESGEISLRKLTEFACNTVAAENCDTTLPELDYFNVGTVSANKNVSQWFGHIMYPIYLLKNGIVSFNR